MASDGWTAADLPGLEGRVVVVTGANSGLGFEATRLLARKGATVVMACRSEARGTFAKGRLQEEEGDLPGTLAVREVDLADLDSVAAFARGVRGEYDRLDALCNNAGIMAVPRGETEDGFERHLGVNHLGHFALTGHLLGLLARTDGETRVVTQSSGAHRGSRMDFADLQGEESYNRWGAYARSKLANLLFAFELQRRLDRAGVSDVTSLGCHPGYAATNLQYRGPRETGSRLRLAAMRVANRVAGQSPETGALPMLYAAFAPGVEGGDYVGPGGTLNIRGSPEVQAPSEAAREEAAAERLWAASEELTGVTYEFGELAAAAAGE